MDIRRSYREASIRGANPVELVVRLYEQMIEDLRQAAKGIEDNDIQLRTNRINHAILVLGYLQSRLDLALATNLGQDLNRFYDGLRRNLMQVQFHASQRSLAQQITDLLAVREAWIEVERVEKSLVGTTAGSPRADISGSATELARSEWKG